MKTLIVLALLSALVAVSAVIVGGRSDGNG